MKPSNVSELLAATIGAREPVLLVGPPGVGKSDLVSQACETALADLIVSHPVIDDPTAGKGYPWLKNGRDHAEHVPYGELWKALNAKKLTVWFLDDFGQALPAVQASYMQPILARSAGGRKLPDEVTFISASNRRTDRAGVSGLLEPVKSRFATIINVEPDLDDWCEWAFDHDIEAPVIAFLRFRPELLCKIEPTLDLVNSPCPRTWTNVNKMLKHNLSAGIELEAISGAVGEAAGNEFVAFLRVWREMPSLDEILANPDHAPIPDPTSALYAVSVGLASRATPKNFGRVAKYATRMKENAKAEFAVLLVRDCIRRDHDICNTQAFMKLASSDLGRLFTGQV